MKKPKLQDCTASAAEASPGELPDADSIVDKPRPVGTYSQYDPKISYTGEGEEREDCNPSPTQTLDEQSNREFLAFVARKASSEDVATLAELGRNANPELAAQFRSQAAPKAPPTPKVLWSERTTGREVSPADFIRQNYGRVGDDGTWDSQGLTRADLKHIDLPLYNAYSQQVHRNPDRAIPELPTEPKRQDSDAQTILDERRERNRLRMARKRAM